MNQPPASTPALEPQASTWARSVVRWGLSILFGAVFLLAWVVFLAANLVSDDLLEPQLYLDALAENRVYDRVYTDLLADPEFQQAATLLLGNVDIDPGLSQDIFSFITATLRLVLPPEDIQDAIEAVINELTAYLGGETDRLQARLELSASIDGDQVKEEIISSVQALIAEFFAQDDRPLQDWTVELTLDELEGYVKELSAGQVGPVPVNLALTALGELSEADKREIIEVLLDPVAESVVPATRLQIEAALAEDDFPGALIIAARELLNGPVEGAVAELEQALDEEELLNSVTALATFAEETEQTVIDRLNRVRDLVAWLNQRLISAMAIILAIALAAIVWVHSADVRSAMRAAGVTLCLSGAVVLLGVYILGSAVQTSYHELLSASNTQLPVSLRDILNDVFGSLASTLWFSVWSTVLVPLIAGLVLCALSFTPRLSDAVRQNLTPVWQRHKPAIIIAVVLVFAAPTLREVILNAGRKVTPRCNGHVELCDRPFDETVFAGTHNSMSVSDYGWLWPAHDGSILLQLEAGVRALLIDTHYWDQEAVIATYLDGLPPDTREVAEAALKTVGLERKDGSFLCHNLCGLGASSLVDTLTDIRLFLEAHPGDVIVLIVQDAITPTDTAQAFKESGLLPLVYTHEPGAPWPTLGEMIERGERVVVMAEEQGPPPDWYHNVWTYTEETPYSFKSLEDFSCAPNRGGTDKPLFLLNHWIERTAPSRVDAAQANEFAFLLDRVRTCAKERGQVPNILAVNFYLTGDLFDVVDELNGVRE